MEGNPWQGWFVQQTATNSPDQNNSQLTEDGTEEYIAREFRTLQENNKRCVAVPPNFELSSDLKRRLGEEAEQTVFKALLNNNIPGLHIVFFNGQRYMGEKDTTAGEITREKDFSVFLEHKEQFYILLLEVKCIKKQNKDNRKKATWQLKEHIKVLNISHNILESQSDKIMKHTVWPNLDREYTCEKCSNQHAVYQPVPPKCPLDKKTQKPVYEEPGWHLFKEKFGEKNQSKFNKWLKHCLTAEKAMDKSCWSKILRIHTQHACGALYNEISKRFLILGADQVALRDSPKHELNKPRLVPGMAGTGKTITVCAKIEHLFNMSKVDSENKVLYICFSDSLIEYVKHYLKGLQCKINWNLIEFKNYKTDSCMTNFFKNKQKMDQLILGDKFKYIFFDEAEDLSVKVLTNLIKEGLALRKKTSEYHLGHFWILFDVFQSDVEIQGISVMGQKRPALKWNGELIEQTLFDEGKANGVIVPLRTVFRMTQNILKHMKELGLNPMLTNPKDSGIEGPKVVIKQVVVDDDILSTLTNDLFCVIKDAFKKNIHNGEVAILFDSKDVSLVLSEKLAELISKLNNKLLKLLSQTKLSPKVTSSIDDESILNPHSESLLKCPCKMFLGTLEEVKGLTLKMVVYLPFFRPDGITPLVVEHHIVSRSSPCYKAVSRSSCEVLIHKIVLTDAIMKKKKIPPVNLQEFKKQMLRQTVENQDNGKPMTPPVVNRH